MSTSSLHVRAATSSDAQDVAAIHIAAWRRAFRGQIPTEVLDALDEAKRAEQFVQILADINASLQVAVKESILVGFFLLKPATDADLPSQTAEIDALYVDPEHWRRGVGLALIEAAFAVATARAFTDLTLWVLESNAMARAFYAHAGFVADGARKVVNRPQYSRVEIRYRRKLSGEVRVG
jgi:GNAT superfamily N-acetyltransferase